MKTKLIITFVIVIMLNNSAHAIDAKYSQHLKHSGCTQDSEIQGCDISKTKEENSKAGFISAYTSNKFTAIKKRALHVNQWKYS